MQDLIDLLEARAGAEPEPAVAPSSAPEGTADRLFRWLDRVLSL